MFSESLQRFTAYTVYMPVRVDKTHPLLAAVTAHRTREEIIGSRIKLINQGIEIIIHGCFLVRVKAKLTVHSFELLTFTIHNTILRQIVPIGKSKTSNFFESALSVFG